MKVPSITKLQPWFNHAEVMKKTEMQLQKDFRFQGIDLPDSGKDNPDYHYLFSWILPYVEELESSHQHTLLNLLYRIDLPEKTIHKYAPEFPDTPFPELLAHLMIRRELQKVVMRGVYN